MYWDTKTASIVWGMASKGIPFTISSLNSTVYKLKIIRNHLILTRIDSSLGATAHRKSDTG